MAVATISFNWHTLLKDVINSVNSVWYIIYLRVAVIYHKNARKLQISVQFICDKIAAPPVITLFVYMPSRPIL